MKKVLLIWIGLLFLFLDIRVLGPIFYPPFQEFITVAPETVEMIIVHLIGDRIKIDLFSDIVGYVLIIWAACKIVNDNEAIMKAQRMGATGTATTGAVGVAGTAGTAGATGAAGAAGTTGAATAAPAEESEGVKLALAYHFVNRNKKAARAFVLAIISLVMYVLYWIMPFVLNGEARYSVGFFLYTAYLFFKCFTMAQISVVCCDLAERIENHAWNNVVAIFMLLAAFAGLIRGLSYFYDLPLTTGIYYVVQTFFTILYTAMIWQRRSYIHD